MTNDRYVRFMLTIIAACLIALTLHVTSVVPSARAAAATTCTGEMRATSSTPIQASIGSSYKIAVTCN